MSHYVLVLSVLLLVPILVFCREERGFVDIWTNWEYSRRFKPEPQYPTPNISLPDVSRAEIGAIVG
jgi:hypothetical protein